jgi:hypothetical protein
MTETNANVVYELAIRNMVRPGTILIVRDRDSLPIYTKDFSHIAYEHEDDEAMHIEMERIAVDYKIPLDWNKLEEDDVHRA